MRPPRFESARQRLNELFDAISRVRAPDLVKLLGRVMLVLAVLELAYVLVANAVLRSSLVQGAVRSGEGLYLDFGSAYTLWPGHLHARDLSLRVEDYNVQFEVALSQVDLDIALTELPFKKIHITRLRAEGTRFRMRHKLLTVGDDLERVAAFPPIRGFADPPYYVGVRPAPIADSDYDLWQVRIEDVVAQVSELWAMEYRFRGSGTARGSFVVKPARWVQVEPASLDLERGTLTLGMRRVAERVHGRITCDIPDMQVQKSDGRQVFADILATLRLELDGGQLDFLEAYLARFAPVRYSGQASWRIDVNVARGVVQPGSHIEAHAHPFEARHDIGGISGDFTLGFARETGASADHLLLAVNAPRLVVSRAGASPAHIDGVTGRLELNAVDLKSELGLGAAALQIQRLHVPSLAGFAPRGTALAGEADASFAISRAADHRISGQARLGLLGGQLHHGELRASSDVQSELAFSRGASDDASLELQKLDVRLTHATLEAGRKRSRPFSALIDGSGLKLGPRETGARGTIRLHASSADALLPLIVGGPLKDITSNVLDLQALDARAAIRVTPDALNLELVDARSGNLRARGYLLKRSREPRAAFLLSSGVLNVGVTLSDGDTHVSPFVSDAWLASTWPNVASGGGSAGDHTAGH